jgi:hypothetical protein
VKCVFRFFKSSCRALGSALIRGVLARETTFSAENSKNKTRHHSVELDYKSIDCDSNLSRHVEGCTMIKRAHTVTPTNSTSTRKKHSSPRESGACTISKDRTYTEERHNIRHNDRATAAQQ